MQNGTTTLSYTDNDPLQTTCPYAAHIRKTNPRDNIPGQEAEILTHRVSATDCPFGPEGDTR